MTQKVWRLELFLNTPTELHQKVLPFLEANTSVKRLNLTNKSKGDQLLQTVQELKTALPDLEICAHYSLKWNYQQSVDKSFDALLSFRSKLAEHSSTSLLLLSGGGKKRKLDTVKALQLLAQCPTTSRAIPPVGVAFNPYFPESTDRAVENRRLRQKLETGLVAAIYLQIGCDLELLRQGFEHAKATIAELVASGTVMQRPTIYGSIFLPNKRMLAQMRFRPWNGVFLSEEYLGSVEAAEAITRQLLGLYAEYDVVPLVETDVRSSQDLRRLHNLLGL